VQASGGKLANKKY